MLYIDNVDEIFLPENDQSYGSLYDGAMLSVGQLIYSDGVNDFSGSPGVMNLRQWNNNEHDPTVRCCLNWQVNKLTNDTLRSITVVNSQFTTFRSWKH